MKVKIYLAPEGAEEVGLGRQPNPWHFIAIGDAEVPGMEEFTKPRTGSILLTEVEVNMPQQIVCAENAIEMLRQAQSYTRAVAEDECAKLSGRIMNLKALPAPEVK